MINYLHRDLWIQLKCSVSDESINESTTLDVPVKVSSQHNTCCLVSHESRSRPKEDVVYCTSLKRRNQLCSDHDNIDPLNGHDVARILQTGSSSSCCVHSLWFELLEPQTFVRVFFRRFALADVWLVSIQRTDKVSLCLRLAGIYSDVHNKLWNTP